MKITTELGHTFPEVEEGKKDKPLAYQYFAGLELHPRLLGVDIKQLTNCRFGMMGWALLVLNFAIASIQLNGFSLGPLVNAGLINLYLLKFFYWETGYFNTLDITLDRAGYYLCWGRQANEIKSFFITNLQVVWFGCRSSTHTPDTSW